MILEKRLDELLLEKYVMKVKRRWGVAPDSCFVTEDQLISYNDWWSCDPNLVWFTRFIRKHFPGIKRKINFYSVFGKGRFIKRNVNAGKIFYSGENIDSENSIFPWKIGNYCLDYVDLSMGFAERSEENYMRFPIWIMYVFAPESNEDDILSRIEEINNVYYEKKYECALISRHDKGGTRTLLCDRVEDILKIKYAGHWRNNTDELWSSYQDNKIEYLKNFKFNICPENVNTECYVTEKIFQAFLAGCIPIYLGGRGNPEPEVINRDILILWETEKDTEKVRRDIVNLKENVKLYKEFLEQPRFLPSAGQYVVEKFEKLKKKMEMI